MNNTDNNPESTSLSSVEALLAQTLRDCGVDPATLFEKAGIDLAVVSNPDARIPTARENHLWQLAIEATANPCLGLEAARHFQPAMLHGLGFAWLASDSLYLARYERSSIIMQVKSRIIDQLVNGMPQQQGVAEALHVSLRSLQRKLRAENTSYKDILNETRQQLALQYIRESHRSIGEITYLLGFTEPSNFARAFKRWTGKSPHEYRTSHL